MASTLSFATLALAALAACGGPVRITEVQDQNLLEAALAEPRLDRAPRASVDYMSVDPKLYGFDASRTGSPHNNVSFDADVGEVGGRSFLFVTRQVDAAHSTLVWLEIGKGQAAQTIDDRIAAPPAQQRLPFDVEAVPGGLVLIHADGARVVERRATPTADGLAFAPARTLATADQPVRVVQLTKTDDHLHALWTTDDGMGWGTAFLCSAALADLAFSAPRALDGQGHCAGAHMAAGSRDLFIAWCDNRWRQRKNWFDGYRNVGKVCLIASRDAGRSFTNAVVLNDPGNFADVAEAVDLVVGHGGLAVYWRKPGEPSSIGRTMLWGLAAVDFELRRMHRSRDVGGAVDRCR